MFKLRLDLEIFYKGLSFVGGFKSRALKEFSLSKYSSFFLPHLQSELPSFVALTGYQRLTASDLHLAMTSKLESATH